jgi:hypothetical protein
MFTVRRRGLAARVGTIAVAVGALAAVALPAASAAMSLPASPAAQTAPNPAKCTTTGVKTTCIGNYNGLPEFNAWNPWTGMTISHPPVVTVSQTKNLTDQIVTVNWQYFTPSLDVSGNPNPGVGAVNYEVNIQECKGTNADSCFGSTEGVQGLGAPGNALAEGGPSAGITYSLGLHGAQGIPSTWSGSSTGSTTGGDPATWKGSAQFHIETGVTNNSLGCDASTPCSLVIRPNFGGGSPYSSTNTSQCLSHTIDPSLHGNLPPNNSAARSPACEVWHQIVVPLHFAPTAKNCPQSAPAFSAEGSPMMDRQMTQWQSAWCTGPAPVSLQFTRFGEQDARNAFLQGNGLGAGIDMALTTLPATASQASSSSRKFTYAPLANSGTAIAYYLDDVNTGPGAPKGQPINQVVLDPRLVAKLTTESYSLSYDCTVSPQSPPWPRKPGAPSQTCDPAVTHMVGKTRVPNPHTLFDDPEFLALNKNCRPAGAAKNYVCGASDFPSDYGNSTNLGVFLPTVPAGLNDMTYQLTDWVGANAGGAAFLAGKADPWGMRVNTNYRNVPYPTQQFQTTLDPGTTYPGNIPCPGGACSGGQIGATMNATWFAVTGLDRVVNNLLSFQPNAVSPWLSCPINFSTCAKNQLTNLPLLPEVPGGRDLFSEMDLGDVGAYQFPAAAMVNAAGAAVAPSQASVEATVRKDMTTNPDGITQHVNLSGKDPAAYPLAMVDYAMVPTCGLPHAKASAIADFLDKVATSGQSQGVSPGQLGPGYYPLTSAQRAQTLKAAQEVKAQQCPSAPKGPKGRKPGAPATTPPPGGTTPPPGGTTPPPGGTTPPPGGTTPTPAGGTTPTPSNTTTTPAANSGGPGTGSTPPGRNGGTYTNSAFGQKSADSGLSGILLPAILLMLLGALLVGSAVWALAATGRWPAGLRWLRGARAHSRTALGRLSGRPVRRA